MPGTSQPTKHSTLHRQIWTTSSMTDIITPPPLDQAATPAEDLEQAKRFLATLDPDPKAFTFQSFDDTDLKRPNSRLFFGPLLDIVAFLVNLNRRKFGVFVTVNRTDGIGRKAENIIAIRALFIDQDDKIGPLKQPLALPASIIVKSGGGSHYYWLLIDGEVLERFTLAQLALAKYYGTDTNVSDLPRVMRMPGFNHN